MNTSGRIGLLTRLGQNEMGRGILDREKNTSKCKEQACLGNKSFNVAGDRVMGDGIIKARIRPWNAS